MDLQSIGISNAFTAPCFYSFQHAHAGGLQIHPNVRVCLLMTYSVDIIRRAHVKITSSMNITNHPCPSFGKEGDAVQISYADT